MKIELRELTEENLQECFKLKVAENQKQYIDSNENSWNVERQVL